MWIFSAEYQKIIIISDGFQLNYNNSFYFNVIHRVCPTSDTIQFKLPLNFDTYDEPSNFFYRDDSWVNMLLDDYLEITGG